MPFFIACFFLLAFKYMQISQLYFHDLLYVFNSINPTISQPLVSGKHFMNTVVSDWQIVTVIDEKGQSVGDVLFCTCLEDTRNRFQPGHYICTSLITHFNTYSCLIKTVTGSLYQVLGDGKRSTIELRYFPLLRQGFSPEQINLFTNLASSK